MGVTVNVNNLSLAHKGSNGISIATIPDVCKTPSPAGPVPIPYPNISMSSDLAKGTKKVKVDGKKMAAVKGSEYSMSTGDEPGTAGGVASSTFKKESSWILYSFDVKFEGKNACRLTDKKFQNHKNTVDLGGNLQAPVIAVPAASRDPECEELEEKIDELVNRDKKQHGGGGTHGLKHRFREQIAGANGPGTKSWDDHEAQIQGQQRGLRRKLTRHQALGCGDPPKDAHKWASKPAPSAKEWKGPA